MRQKNNEKTALPHRPKNIMVVNVTMKKRGEGGGGGEVEVT